MYRLPVFASKDVDKLGKAFCHLFQKLQAAFILGLQQEWNLLKVNLFAFGEGLKRVKYPHIAGRTLG